MREVGQGGGGAYEDRPILTAGAAAASLAKCMTQQQLPLRGEAHLL